MNVMTFEDYDSHKLQLSTDYSKCSLKFVLLHKSNRLGCWLISNSTIMKEKYQSIEIQVLHSHLDCPPKKIYDFSEE